MGLLLRGMALAGVLVALLATAGAGLVVLIRARRVRSTRGVQAGVSLTLLSGAAFVVLASWGTWRAVARTRELAGRTAAGMRVAANRAVAASKQEARHAVGVAWKSAVDEVFSPLTYVSDPDPHRTFTTFVVDPVPSEIRFLRGARVRCTAFDEAYLVYETDEDFLLRFVPSLPAQEVGDLSNDRELVPSTFEAEREGLTFIREKFLNQELAFFDVEAAAGGRAFTCVRYPLVHTLLFKPGSRIVYHHVELLWN